MYLLIYVFLVMGRFVGQLYVRGMCSLPLMYHPVHAEKWHKWAWRGWMGGGVVLSSPWPVMSVPRHGWSREVCEPMAHPPRHPPIPSTHPYHPSTHQPTPPTTHSPTHPLVPITHVLLLLLLHPHTYPSHPPTQPPIHAPQPPNHSPTNPKHI